MEYKGSVPVERILAEDTMFKISTGAASAGLVESIRLVGLLNPPILIACSGGFRIVSGFKRIAALRQLDISSIPARLLDPATAVERCIRIAIIENSSQRQLNLVEQANAIGLLAAFCIDNQQLADAACSAGLSVNPDIAEKLKKLADMEAPLKKGVLDGTVALPVAIQIHDMKDATDRQTIGTLLKELGLSLNRQREILEWVVSISRRDDISVTQLLMTEEIVNWMQDTNIDRRQKGQLVRKCLKTRRYPAIQSYEKRFDGIVKKLKLAKGTSLIAPPHFESPNYGLRFEFRNYHELLWRLKEFENIIKSDVLKSMWDDPDDLR